VVGGGGGGPRTPPPPHPWPPTAPLPHSTPSLLVCLFLLLDEVVHMCQIGMMWHRVGRCDMADGPQIIWRQVEKGINLK
jgi:hypothetical protein